MAKKSEQLTLDELRDKSAKSKTKLSFGKEMGGYNKKQVNEYIDTFTENLRSAEESFNNRLEEYAAMITMLKQERDQYGEMYNLCKASKFEMSNQIDELKRENEELNRLTSEMSVKQIPQRAEPLDRESESEEVVYESQKKLEEYLSYEQESQEMKAQLDQLKAMVRELNSEIETYARENLPGSVSESAFVDQIQESNNVLKSQYDDILRERKALLTEKNRLMEVNNKLLDEVSVLDAQLKIANGNCDARIQALNINADKFIENHQQTLIQLAENMENSLNLIKIESDDLLELKTKIILSPNNQDL